MGGEETGQRGASRARSHDEEVSLDDVGLGHDVNGNVVCLGGGGSVELHPESR